jgi:L-aspartate oxidase
VDPSPRPGPEALVPAASRARVQRVATDGPGVLRSADGLRHALAALAAIPTDAHERRDDGRRLGEPQLAEWETTNVHQVATVLALAALAREESRGGHARSDFPATAEEWRVRVGVNSQPGGAVQIGPRSVG